MCMFCFFKQKTAYEMRMCDWRSDVCSSDLGTTAFDAVTSTTFWADVVGTSAGWGATSFASIGLLWLVAIVAAAYIGAVKVAGLLGAAGEPPLLRPLGLALVPLAAAWFIAHDITLLMAEGQNLIVLLPDPIGRGWDLFGTIDSTVDFGLVEEPWVRLLQLGLLA